MLSYRFCFLQKKSEEEKNRTQNGQVGSGREIPKKQVQAPFSHLVKPSKYRTDLLGFAVGHPDFTVRKQVSKTVHYTSFLSSGLVIQEKQQASQ